MIDLLSFRIVRLARSMVTCHCTGNDLVNQRRKV